jgi:GDP-L-fucose synthase
VRAFITGGHGFLGTALARFLVERDVLVTRPTSRECDLTRQGALESFGTTKYDVVYHLAAWTQAGDFCLRHPGEQWIINQKLNTNTVEWWATHQPQAKFVFMGTSCAYAPGNDLVESKYMDGEPIDSLYTYAMTKRMLYQGARALHLQYGLRYLCAVPSTLYGPGYHTDGRQMHFIFDLIRKIIRGKEIGEPVILWGDGYQRREIILVDDFVRTLYQLVDTVDNDIFNIGAGEEFQIRTFARMICEVAGYPEGQIIYDTSRYVGATSKCLGVDKVKKVLPEYSITPLAEGLRQTIAWFYESKAYLL